MTLAFGVISLKDWVWLLWLSNLLVKLAKQVVKASIILITSLTSKSPSWLFDYLVVQFLLSFLGPPSLWVLAFFNALSLGQFGLVVRTYVFHLLGTYLNILCNWLILWQNALYLYLDRSRMFLMLQETGFQDQVLKSSSLSKKTSWKCKFIKAWQLHLLSLGKLFQPSMLNTCSTAIQHLLSVEV